MNSKSKTGKIGSMVRGVWEGTAYFSWKLQDCEEILTKNMIDMDNI